MSEARTVGPARWQQCASCGARLDERDPGTTCPECNGLLDIRFHLPAGRGHELRRDFGARLGALGSSARVSGVWRYAELLMEAAARDIVSFPEGNTPLLDSAAVSAWAGSDRLLLKHEGMNPTGSFKDRGMTVGVTQARRVGARAVACASTGNTSASLAAYAAIAGLTAYVLVPAGKVAPGKLAQTMAYGARTLAVRGNFDDCLTLVRDASRRLGVYLLNSVNPWRIEGQKTIVFELLQQMSWRAPDWIALPAGNLGNTAAFGKALSEATTLGLIDRMPRLLAVQASGAAPFARGFSSGFVEHVAVEPNTIATAIRIGDPASWDRAVRAIEATNGVAIAVDDADIVAAQRCVGRAGIGCEPASAASVAGVRAAIATGVIEPAASVVAVLTGHVLKDPWPEMADPAVDGPAGMLEVDATPAAIERALAESA